MANKPNNRNKVSSPTQQQPQQSHGNHSEETSASSNDNPTNNHSNAEQNIALNVNGRPRTPTLVVDRTNSDRENQHSSSLSLPKTIIIPPTSVTITTKKSLSSPSEEHREQLSLQHGQAPLSASKMSVSINRSRESSSAVTDTNSPSSVSSPKSQTSITREQFEYGNHLKNGEVQVLYRSPESQNSTQLGWCL